MFLARDAVIFSTLRANEPQMDALEPMDEPEPPTFAPTEQVSGWALGSDSIYDAPLAEEPLTGLRR